MRRFIKALVTMVSLSAVVTLASPAGADASRHNFDIEPFFEFDDQVPEVGDQIVPSFNVLKRGEDGISNRMLTRVEPGHAFTLWYVLFNAPENCSDGVCGPDDVLLPGGVPNASQIQAARISIVWANVGEVSTQHGFLAASGSLAEGEIPGPGQILIGRAEDGAIVPVDSPVTGLEDAKNAVVAVIVRDHGAAFDDPALFEQQLSWYGVCNPGPGLQGCNDIQLAQH